MSQHFKNFINNGISIEKCSEICYTNNYKNYIDTICVKGVQTYG